MSEVFRLWRTRDVVRVLHGPASDISIPAGGARPCSTVSRDLSDLKMCGVCPEDVPSVTS